MRSDPLASNAATASTEESVERQTRSRPIAVWVCILSATLPAFRVLPAPELWVYGALALAVAPVVVGYGRRPVAGLLWLACGVLALVATVVSTSASLDPESSYLIGLQLVIWFTLGPFAARGLYALDQGRTLRLGAIAFVLGQSVSSLAALAQGAFGTSVFGWSAELGRAPGLAGHPNVLGVLAGVSIVLCVGEMSRGRLRLAAAAALVVNLGGLLACGSISALISCLAGLAVYLLASRAGGADLLRLAAIAVAAVLAVLWATASSVNSPLDRLLQVTGQTQAQGSFELRQLTVDFALSRISADPILGAGLDDISGGTYDGRTVTHMILIRAWFQGGITLALAFLCLFIVIFFVIARSIVRAGNAHSASVLTVVAGFALTSAALQQGYFWFPVLGALAFVAPRARHPDPTRPDQRGGRAFAT